MKHHDGTSSKEGEARLRKVMQWRMAPRSGKFRTSSRLQAEEVSIVQQVLRHSFFTLVCLETVSSQFIKQNVVKGGFRIM
jgi:hypothetical protein